jgi:serine/threonine protein kinase/tetratricopeptide (TPR) repeat protein
LLKLGASADTVTDAKQSAFHPPSVAELSPLFPQLEILELIGKGGMGAVYQARQKQLDRIVALKILPPGIGNEPAFAERFTREAKALAKLSHPNIVTLYEFGDASGQFYFLMEFVDGVNLRQLLHAGRISAREALAIVPQICDALQFAHDQGIVHRDIKPENILMDRRGRVKVADFGLAKIIDGRAGSPLPAAGDMQTGAGAQGTARPTNELTDAGKVMGTPQYMSPEQIQAPGEVDHRADIYALGVVFYQMLTGELPGKKLEAPSKKVSIDVRLDEIVLRALEKKPELRYQQVSEVKTMVESITAESQKEDVGSQKPKGWFRQFVPFGPPLPKTRFSKFINYGWYALFSAMVVLAVYRRKDDAAWAIWNSWFTILMLLGLVDTFFCIRKERMAGKTQLGSSGRESAQTEKSEIGNRQPAIPSRFSRTAIVGACLVAMGLLSVFLSFFVDRMATRPMLPAGGVLANQPAMSAAPALIGAALLYLFFATLLGWISVSQIRRSAGKLHGLWLAVFNGLFFPLLLLDAIIFGLVWLVIKFLVVGQPGDMLVIGYQLGMFFTLWLCVAAILSVVVDWLIIRRVWRAVNITPKVDALPAIEAWLALMDDGDYAQSWDAAAKYFQKTISKEEWIDRLGSARRPQGKVITRKLRTARGFGSRYTVKFDTQFAGLKAAVETVYFSRERDGQWRAIGYLILPAYADETRSGWLGKQALFWSVLALLSGVVSVCVWPKSPGKLDWLVYVGVLWGIVYGGRAYQTRAGKSAFIISFITLAIWLLVFVFGYQPVVNFNHATPFQGEPAIGLDWPTNTASRSQFSDFLFKSAIREYENQRNTNAMNIYDFMFRAFPEISREPGHQLQVAQILNTSGHASAALEIVSRLETNGSDYVKDFAGLVWLAKGNALKQLGRYDDAMIAYSNTLNWTTNGHQWFSNYLPTVTSSMRDIGMRPIHTVEPADLREARAKLAQLRVNYAEQNTAVQRVLARVKELERMSKDEPNAPKDLREAKAQLAELRVDYAEQNPRIQEALARIKALDAK